MVTTKGTQSPEKKENEIMKQFAIEEQLNSIACKALKGDYADALEDCVYAKGYLAGIATAQDAIENDDHTLTFVLRVTEEEYKKIRGYILELQEAIYDKWYLEQLFKNAKDEDDWEKDLWIFVTNDLIKGNIRTKEDAKEAIAHAEYVFNHYKNFDID